MSIMMEFPVRSLCLLMFAFAVHVVLWNARICSGESKTSLVTGMVFCDQCLLGTLSALSQTLAGAQVSLECYQGSTTAIFWASTDENGVFSITVQEDDFQIHGDGRCTVKLVRSADMECYIPTDIANGSSGATISSARGVYRERAVYYVGPFAYRMSRPAKACDALQLDSRHEIILESSELPVESLGASSRGLKTVGRGFAEEMPTVPSSASTIPSTATSTAKPPSYSIPVTRPTPARRNQSRVKHSGVPAGNNHSPTKCIPLPPVPLDPELITQLHYPPCKDEPPKGGGAIPMPTPRAPSPIGPGSPILPPKGSPPEVGSAPPKAHSPSYGGSPTTKLPPPPPLSPPPPLTLPPPASGPNPALPSPTTPSPPSPPHKKHPIHRPHPHHRPPPLAQPPPTHCQTPVSHPSPSPYKNPPHSQLRYPPLPFPHLKPSPPLTPQSPSTPKLPPHHPRTPDHIPLPSPSPPPQPPSTIPLPLPHPPPPSFPHPPPPFQYHKP